MRKWTLALLGATAAFALSCGAAHADYTATIFDATQYGATTGVDYSHGYDTRVNNVVDNTHWFDNSNAGSGC